MGLWLKPYVIRCTIGVYLNHMILEECLYGAMNYVIMGLERDIGGQGGDINVHGEMWNPSLWLGLLRWFGHSHHSYMSSTSMLCGGVELRRFGRK